MTPKGFESGSNAKRNVNYLNPKRVYLTLIVIYLLAKNRFDHISTIKQDLQELIRKYESKIDGLERKMGFPENWDNENIWLN